MSAHLSQRAILSSRDDCRGGEGILQAPIFSPWTAVEDARSPLTPVPAQPRSFWSLRRQGLPHCMMMPQRIFKWLSSQRSLDLCIWFDVGWRGGGQLGGRERPFGEKEEGEEASGWVLLCVSCLRCVDLTCWPVPGLTLYKYGGGVLGSVWLFVTPWTVARQVPLPLGLSRQEYWSGLSFPPPGDLPDSGIEPESPTVARGFITTWATSKALTYMVLLKCIAVVL